MVCPGNCVEIPIQRRDVKMLVSPEDVELCLARKWYMQNHGYASTAINLGKRGCGPSKYEKLLAHRFILGPAPSPQHRSDHIDGNRLHNCRGNLRWATATESQRNRTFHNKTGYKGVVVHERRQSLRFSARICLGNDPITRKRNRIVSGPFATVEEAARAYNKLALQYFGEFARLNVIVDAAPGRAPATPVSEPTPIPFGWALEATIP